MVQALWTLGPWPGGHLRETLRDSSSMRTAWLPAADRQARDSAETLMHKREPPRRSISQAASSMTSPARWLRSRAACRSSTTIDAQAESASSDTLNRLASLRPKVPAPDRGGEPRTLGYRRGRFDACQDGPGPTLRRGR